MKIYLSSSSHFQKQLRRTLEIDKYITDYCDKEFDNRLICTDERRLMRWSFESNANSSQLIYSWYWTNRDRKILSFFSMWNWNNRRHLVFIWHFPQKLDNFESKICSIQLFDENPPANDPSWNDLTVKSWTSTIERHKTALLRVTICIGQPCAKFVVKLTLVNNKKNNCAWVIPVHLKNAHALNLCYSEVSV